MKILLVGPYHSNEEILGARRPRGDGDEVEEWYPSCLMGYRWSPGREVNLMRLGDLGRGHLGQQRGSGVVRKVAVGTGG